ncbi:MAG TPA: hypothetical protein VHJ00_06330 [Bradyrhizobium sp.]|jgi:hypothetical protein|nr:hypothetical protein [Bradyrhizobium sp.]
MVTSPTTVHCDTTTFSSGPAQSGTEFNDATRLLDNAGTASGPVAQGHSGHISGQGEVPQEAGERDGRPVPSFWNFAENKPGHNGNDRRFELRRHHA